MRSAPQARESDRRTRSQNNALIKAHLGKTVLNAKSKIDKAQGILDVQRFRRKFQPSNNLGNKPTRRTICLMHTNPSKFALVSAWLSSFSSTIERTKVGSKETGGGDLSINHMPNEQISESHQLVYLLLFYCLFLRNLGRRPRLFQNLQPYNT